MASKKNISFKKIHQNINEFKFKPAFPKQPTSLQKKTGIGGHLHVPCKEKPGKSDPLRITDTVFFYSKFFLKKFSLSKTQKQTSWRVMEWTACWGVFPSVLTSGRWISKRWIAYFLDLHKKQLSPKINVPKTWTAFHSCVFRPCLKFGRPEAEDLFGTPCLFWVSLPFCLVFFGFKKKPAFRCFLLKKTRVLVVFGEKKHLNKLQLSIAARKQTCTVCLNTEKNSKYLLKRKTLGQVKQRRPFASRVAQANCWVLESRLKLISKLTPLYEWNVKKPWMKT